jgi:hypothetical protein
VRRVANWPRTKGQIDAVTILPHFARTLTG